MAIAWNFNADDYEEKSFKPIPVGDHRVRIAKVEECKTSTNKDAYKIILDVSGYSSTLWYYLVFDPANVKMVNQNLGNLWSSFGIPFGTMDYNVWVGKVGACRVKHEPYNGEDKANVAYFLTKEKQEQLPAWREAPGKATVTGNNAAYATPSNFETVSPDDLPFDL